MTALTLALIAAYIWGLMVASDHPAQLSVRRAAFGIPALVLVLIAKLLVEAANLLADGDSEVWP